MIWIISVILIVCIIIFLLLEFYLERLQIRRERDLLSVWVDNLIKNRRVTAFFDANSIHSISIIGYNALSDKLIKELYCSSVSICFVVDDRYCNSMSFVPGIRFVRNKEFIQKMNENCEQIGMVLVIYDEDRNKYNNYGANVESIERIVKYLSMLD